MDKMIAKEIRVRKLYYQHKQKYTMKKIIYINIFLLLIGFVSHGQNTNQVEIFNGNGEMNNAQKILDLSYRNLNEIPAIAINPEIETLILDNNNLSRLPDWIRQLKNLKTLSLRNNKFKTLNYAVNTCINLEQLYLSGNKELSDISVITTNSSLKLIDVTDTKINELPAWVQMMDNLFYFKYTKKE